MSLTKASDKRYCLCQTSQRKHESNLKSQSVNESVAQGAAETNSNSLKLVWLCGARPAWTGSALAALAPREYLAQVGAARAHSRGGPPGAEF